MYMYFIEQSLLVPYECNACICPVIFKNYNCHTNPYVHKMLMDSAAI